MLKKLLTSKNPEDYHRAIYAYQPRIQYLVERFCPSFTTTEKEEALDYIQSGLEEDDFSRLRKYNPESSTPQTFLNRLTRNLIIDYIRKSRGRKALFSKIEKLSETHQTIFKLKFWKGYQDREVHRLLEMQHGLKLSEEKFDQVLREVHDVLTDLNMWRLVSDNRWMQSYEEAGPSEEATFGGQSHSPEDLYIQKETDEKRAMVETILKDIFNQLSSAEKFILASKFCDDKSARQIADMLGISTKRVYRKLDSILEKFSESMAKEGISDFSELEGGSIPIEGIFKGEKEEGKGG